jgi:hypothetical protein
MATGRPAGAIFLAWVISVFSFPACLYATQFVEVAQSAGVRYLHVVAPPLDSDWFYMTGGAAAGDYDNDGWCDLYVTLLHTSDILFRNKGDDTFEEVTQAAGLADPNVVSNGAAWGDIDNDGDLDLYVTTFSPDDRFFLYVNNGDGSFSEEGLLRGVAMQDALPRFGYAPTFGDFDRDGWLDILTSEWGIISGSNGNTHARLLRNQGAANPGHFENVTMAANIKAFDNPTSVQVYWFAPRFSDLDGDMWPDIAIAADFRSSRLFWNNRDGTFMNGTLSARVGTDENGMGSAMGDYDGDGDLDWFVTSIFDPNESCENYICNWGYTGNRLYRNEGNRYFTDVTDDAGVRDGKWGWGAAFFEDDNDGDQDLTMTNGVVFSGTSLLGQYLEDPMRLWENDGSGNYTDVAVAKGITDTGPGKGLLVFDYDRDGDLDLFVVNNNGYPVLYQNEGGNTNDWIRIKVVGTVSNRQGIGAFVTVTPDTALPDQKMVREINTGSHFLGQSETTAHFGLGPAFSGSVDQVTIKWPSGLVQQVENLATNTEHVVTEPHAVCADGIYPSPYPDGDYNKDCKVDMIDLSLFTQMWLTCTVNCD